MSSSRLLALPVLAGLALVAGSMVFLGGQPAVAAGGSLDPLVDGDGDGLEDALEARLQTDPTAADTDLDGYTDAEELLLGTDPRQPETAAIKPRPSLKMDLYRLGDRVYVQVFVLHRTSMLGFQFGWADRYGQLTLPDRYMGRYVARRDSLPTPWVAWSLEVATLSVPATWFDGRDSLAIGVGGIVDFQELTSVVQLIRVEGVLAQFRPDNTQAGQGAPAGSGAGAGTGRFSFAGDGGVEPGGEAGGGLFPVEPPDGGGGQQGTTDEVCVQILQPIGYLGGARVLYQVVDASCDAMPGAICLNGCSLTIGTTVIGLDPVGLLPG